MNVAPSPRLPSPPGCGVTTFAFREARLSEMAAVRSEPCPAGGPALPPRFLRHADEHSVVGVRAVLQALAEHPRPPSVASHAVVAAPCQAGRLTAAQTLAALPTGGAASVSPHLVPQCSLHSIAGAVSVALGTHGPHLGVGGGPDALAEGLFTAATLLTDGGDPDCSAAWLVATEWDDEPCLDGNGAALNDPTCRALAMLLEPIRSPDDGGEDMPELSLAVQMPTGSVRGPRLHEPAGGLVAFATALSMCREGGALAWWTIGCPWGGAIRVAGRPRGSATFRREAA
ncbi:MAG: hypothetical protein O3C39_04065 [Planctomycetota bacterium]|jgi:hypothetical protein|nr:hypothetical protein [Planctomycetota bacterium]MDA1200837.1 hypothetical protein [Planctomycetota bacterium]